ncbi:hypothetical protein OD917_20115 [Flavobacterium sp. SH_e]|uniref:hypothetical protein n=1 Tax=Flavobacterium TaxID=237 RepID=UPI0021E4BA4C|nr:hypothetical protein [Flavobacterium sp. SH_e]MCV2487250.1 hypothetical protein [Flavobacterium sp. SH_e]
MKKFLVFTVLLVSSFCTINACGYSPYGEDIRYSILKPEYFSFSAYRAFYYNADLWGFNYDEYDSNKTPDANILDWYNYANKKVSIEAIEDFNFNLSFTDINPESNNELIQYLYKQNKKDAIVYLKTAKKIELNTNEDDPWERNQFSNDNQKSVLLDEVIQKIKKEKNIYFKRKYAFLAIRLAYYSFEIDKLESIFESNFNAKQKDYLYYWSLFFYTMRSSDPEKIINVVNLMANSAEKRYASYYFFHNEFKIGEALKYAKSKEEIANVYAYASMQKVDKNLDYLQEINKNKPKSEILDFLLLREINKIEDWVYTPYYSNYLPSVEFSIQASWFGKDKITTQTLQKRSENNRLYAREVLNFINSIEINRMQNPIVWKAAQINLQFITRDYSNCLKRIESFEKEYPNEKITEEIEKIKALCITSNQEKGKAVIKPEIETIILKYRNDERFIFALGRELEFRGNIADGLALISLMSNKLDYGFDYDNVEWRSNRIKTSGNLEVFYTYFDYLDFVYSAKDLQKIGDKIEEGNKTNFQIQIYAQLIKDKDYLKDLLGTKYIREDQLGKALITFKSLPEKYWEDNYNAWERGKYSEYHLFDQNPFYDFKHTKSFIKHTEKYLVTKLSVTEHLIKYTNLANNSNTKDRDYYCFLLGNCYYNMTDYGNSWMMRRYGSVSYYADYKNESFIDEIEYRNRIKAVENYKLAYQYAKTKQFKALCLRMMDYAEKNQYTISKRVDKEFPEYSSDLSGCENLEEYFKARR